jgi:nitrogen fixation/metabolism regulation signal transduction histidine kinase
MQGRGLQSRRITDLVVVAIIYAIVLIGSFAFVRNAMDTQSGLPDMQSGITALLLALTPAALVVVLGVSGFRFIRERRRKAWGYRLRTRMVIAFMAAVAMAGVPSALFLGQLAIRAVEMPGSTLVRTALDAGLDLALAYYAEKEDALQYAAEHDVATILATRGTDADKVLGRLKARDPVFCAVELLRDGNTFSFSGDIAARAATAGAMPGGNAFMPRLTVNGITYARYFARVDATISAIVTIRFPERIDDTATALAAASGTIANADQFGGSFTAYLAFFSASIVFPLAALALLFAMSAADDLLRPVAALSDALGRIEAGARRAPFLAKPGDEAGDLVEKLNSVLEGLERSRGDELRNEKIGAWRDIARKLAHELRNPLTPIRLSAERVLKRWKADPASASDILEKSMVAIIQETTNMETLLTEFRDFARLPEPQKDWMELKPMVDEAVHLYSASWPSVRFGCDDIEPGIVLRADRGYLKQALGNLIANAADATDGLGHIWIRADLVKTAESRYCRIQIRDDGHGIPAEHRDKVFSPYFTTKPGGTGLGLAIVEHIVAAHGGKIRFDSGIGAGTVFIIDLPADSA